MEFEQLKRILITLALIWAGSAHGQDVVYYTQPQTVAYQPVVYTLQSIAYARAVAMAQIGWMIDGTANSHAIPNAPAIPYGVSEGVGMAVYSDAPTCMFPGACVADAIVQGVNGWFYRVRFFQ